jgi:hypothetical protein
VIRAAEDPQVQARQVSSSGQVGLAGEGKIPSKIPLNDR